MTLASVRPAPGRRPAIQSNMNSFGERRVVIMAFCRGCFRAFENLERDIALTGLQPFEQLFNHAALQSALPAHDNQNRTMKSQPRQARLDGAA
jgi:hypothetical protein